MQAVMAGGLGLELDWSKALATGHDGVDADHGELFRLIEALRQPLVPETGADPNTVSAVMNKLVEYAKYHFEREEALMASFNYDDIDRHKRAHAGFCRKLDEINAETLCNGDEPRVNLAKFLYDWLLSHILNLDQIMVGKMIGTDRHEWMQNLQTQKVIDGAYVIANHIEQSTVYLRTASNEGMRSRLRKDISKSSERLINLVSLAEMRIQQFECPIAQRNRLAAIEDAVRNTAYSLAIGYAEKVIAYGGAMMEGKAEVPLGCGSKASELIQKVEMLVGISVRDSNKISDEDYNAFVKSYYVANKLYLFELVGYNPDVIGDDNVAVPSKFKLPEVLKSRAATQKEVLSAA